MAYLKDLLPDTTPSPDVQVDEIGHKLLFAAEIIRTRGWCQGEFMSEGRVCVVGALNIASGVTDSISSRTPAEARLIQFLGKKDICGWNDRASSVDEVLSALTSAALSSRSQG